MTHPRKRLKEISRCLEDYGIRVIGDQIGSKNRRLRITDGTKQATLIVSLNPSDWRVDRNIAKTAVKALREAP